MVLEVPVKDQDVHTLRLGEDGKFLQGSMVKNVTQITSQEAEERMS